MERVSMIGKINAVKEPKARKPSEWDLSIQFINEDRPTILEYSEEDAARADYKSLVTACEEINQD